jgi:hypothetical protein
LIAEAKNRAGVDAGGLVESINGKRALEPKKGDSYGENSVTS